MNPTTNPKNLNDIDLIALGGVIDAVRQDPSVGQVHFHVQTDWKGQVRSETHTRSFTLGGQEIERPYRIASDEPNELLGTNAGPNPQELIMAALNACMTVGFVAGAAAEGIALESLSIETACDVDLRGFLAIDASVPAGAPQWRQTFRVKGDGTPEQFAAILEHVKKTSPNFFHVVNAIAMDAQLEVE